MKSIIFIAILIQFSNKLLVYMYLDLMETNNDSIILFRTFFYIPE